MHKKRKTNKSNYINFICPSETPTFVVKYKRIDSTHGIKRWAAIKTVIGILACFVLAIGAYVATTQYIIPASTSSTAIAAIQETSSSVPNSTEIKENEVTIKYDSKTGLPLYADQEILFAVNRKNPLPETFSPKLASFQEIQVDQKMVSALRMMTQKAEESGITLQFESGWISKEKQTELYEEKIKELVLKEKYTKVMAGAKAQTFVPKPGEADAQTGLCVTIKADQRTFPDSTAYTWLNKFSVDYGFVFRYPAGKEELTGMNADLRVLRYVGTDNAVKMRQLSLCMEEYVEYKANQ
ncbi:MAG: M15 family metallopeptidase [Oscillospiraceae bacterium]